MATQTTIRRTSAATLNLIHQAKAAGVAKDALKRFLTAGYIPQPKQLLFHAAARLADIIPFAIDIGYGGARGGAKTHTIFAQVALDDCQRFPGLKVLFLRKVAKSANEAVEDLRASVLKHTPHRYKENKSTIIFPNGSRIIIGHFQYEKDIDNYLGLEYDIIVIEEATQLSQSKIDKIKTCNRSAKPGFRPRRYYSTNPGGVGHTWFKRTFIEPYRSGTETTTKFIPATVKDNKYLNPEYIRELEALTGWLRKAWLDGDWDVFAGQFFTTFNYDLHTVPPDDLPKEIPDTWESWGSLDYGFTHNTVAYAMAEYDGEIFVLDEHYGNKKGVPFHAERIKQMLARHGLSFDQLQNFVAGTDVFAQRGAASAETISDQYEREGIKLSRANTDRIAGAGRILELFGDIEEGVEPKIKISRRCALLIEQIPAMQHNPNNPEDVLKVNMGEEGSGGDDGYDAFRYGVASNRSIGITI
jgi:phage terminase large subunit